MTCDTSGTKRHVGLFIVSVAGKRVVHAIAAVSSHGRLRFALGRAALVEGVAAARALVCVGVIGVHLLGAPGAVHLGGSDAVAAHEKVARPVAVHERKRRVVVEAGLAAQLLALRAAPHIARNVHAEALGALVAAVLAQREAVVVVCAAGAATPLLVTTLAGSNKARRREQLVAVPARLVACVAEGRPFWRTRAKPLSAVAGPARRRVGAQAHIADGAARGVRVEVVHHKRADHTRASAK